MAPESTTLTTIKEVAILQTRTPSHGDEFACEFPGLEGAFRQSVKVYWLFPEDPQFPRLESFRHKNLHVHPVPFTLVDPKIRSGNWEWLQDPFIVVPGPRPIFVIPAQATIQDQLIVLALARSSGAQVRMARTYFEGGNALWFGERLVLGKDTILQNEEKERGESHWEIREAIEEDFGPEPITWIGDILPVEKVTCQPCSASLTFQPFFHLDLFLMPTGVNSSGIPRIAVASLDDSLSETKGQEGQRLADRLKRQLEHTAKQIRKAFQPEIEVVRVPLLAYLSNNQPRVFSPCNGLFESTPRGERVILPDFTHHAPANYWLPRLRRQQEMLETVWEKRGLRVVWVQNGFFEDVEKCGALHCRIKIIRRQQP